MASTYHPESEELSAFVNGGLAEQEAAAIESHINDCDECCGRLENIATSDNEFVSQIQDAIQAPRIHQLSNVSRRIGSYKLLQRIGVGGMGEVWMAEQEEPVRRRVALKLTHAGPNSKEVIARFEAERQALSMMDHPNIAKVLDAGTTDNGNPYFVMELVKGIPLIKYCDDRKLGVRKRLELFIAICRAVHHAHQKGIIHRDLKPSNILIAQYDGEPVPRVIDFGLAKAMNNSMSLTDKTIFTEFGKVVGTLNYMSPEQAELNELDVDTRTDIYSLGVILYELLTGTTPIDEDTIRSTAFLKVLEIIRESDPPCPSVRLSASNAAQLASEKRNIQLRALQQALNGELDWIVMKALDKNRNRRFDSASSFADDVFRYLNDEPVLARPATRSYLLKRFISKNAAFAATFAFIFVLLAVATTVSSYFAYRANQSANEARLSAKRSDDVLAIVSESFRSAAPNTGAQANMSAKQVLEKAKDSLRQNELDFEGKAKLLEALGDSFFGIGENASAIEVRRDLVELTAQNLGPDHLKTLQRKSELATCFMRNGEVEKSAKLLEEIVPLLEKNGDSSSITPLGAKVNLVGTYFYLKRFDDAIVLGEPTLESLKQEFGPDNLATMQLMVNLAGCYNAVNRDDEALALAELSLNRMRKNLGETYPDTLNAQFNYSTFLRKSGRDPEKAKALLEKTVSQIERKVGMKHDIAFRAMFTLAQTYFADNQLNHALELASRLHRFATANHGSNHPRTLAAQNLCESIEDVVRSNQDDKS